MEHNKHHPHHHKPKKAGHHYLIYGAIAVLVIAGVYYWHKNKNPMICREICFSTGDEAHCSEVCINKNEVKR